MGTYQITEGIYFATISFRVSLSARRPEREVCNIIFWNFSENSSVLEAVGFPKTKWTIATAQDFSELRQTIDDAFTKLEELEEEGKRSKLIDTIHCSPARFICTIILMVMMIMMIQHHYEPNYSCCKCQGESELPPDSRPIHHLKVSPAQQESHSQCRRSQVILLF